MFTLPSMWNLVVSTIVFFIAAWYIRRYLNEQGLPKGTTHGLLVFAIASLIHGVRAKRQTGLRKKYRGSKRLPHPRAIWRNC